MPLWAAALLAAAIVLTGATAGHSLTRRRIERHEKHLADRLAAGEDRYFEELRALKAYDPRRRSPRFNAIAEAIGIAVSFAALILLFSGLKL
jgi:hypothetical protein